MTREDALNLLREHGIEPDQPSAIGPDGTWALETTFDKEVGIKDTYTLREVLIWLGY